MSRQMNRGPPDDLKVAELVKVGLGVLSKMAIGAGTKMVRVPCLYFYIRITTVHFNCSFTSHHRWRVHTGGFIWH